MHKQDVATYLIDKSSCNWRLPNTGISQHHQFEFFITVCHFRSIVFILFSHKFQTFFYQTLLCSFDVVICFISSISSARKKLKFVIISSFCYNVFFTTKSYLFRLWTPRSWLEICVITYLASQYLFPHLVTLLLSWSQKHVNNDQLCVKKCGLVNKLKKINDILCRSVVVHNIR